MLRLLIMLTLGHRRASRRVVAFRRGCRQIRDVLTVVAAELNRYVFVD
jgi:hypothetical protein